MCKLARKLAWIALVGALGLPGTTLATENVTLNFQKLEWERRAEEPEAPSRRRSPALRADGALGSKTQDAPGVADGEGASAPVDTQGRTKVRFHWDR